MKDLSSLLKTRRSVRQYSDKDISDEVLREIVDCARFAPTARNDQPWIFIAVRDKEKIKHLSKVVSPNGAFMKDASAAIVVFCCQTKYYLEDGCSTLVYALLSAWNMGIGSCWIAGDKKPYCKAVSAILKVPDEYKLIGLISLGYPKEILEKTKKDLNEVLFFEEYKRCT